MFSEHFRQGVLKFWCAQNHLQGFLKHGLLGSTSGVSDSVSLRSTPPGDCAFLTSSEVVLMLLVLGPHGEIHSLRPSRVKHKAAICVFPRHVFHHLLPPTNKWMGPEPRFHSFPDEFPLEEVVYAANRVPKPHSRDSAHSLTQIYSYSSVLGSFLACVQDAQIWEDKREFTLLSVHLKAFVLKFLILEFWGLTVREKS